MKKSEISVILGALILIAASLPALAQNGLTWTKTRVDDIVGVIDVGCGYTPGVGNQCNPYSGDTPCTGQLPLLCFLDLGLEQPADVVTPSRYHQWSGGVVATTDPVAGNTFRRIADADAYCADKFGPHWRVAEFHDGWGWYFLAYGNVGDNVNQSRGRFWIDILDQRNGTCWAR
jgi:hypothetical protein